MILRTWKSGKVFRQLEDNIMTELTKTDPSYSEWVLKIINQFRQSQIRAALMVNGEMLRFYWILGRDISMLHLESEYGIGFYKRLSRDLKEHLPNVRSFSVTNLKYMKYFYELYPTIANRPKNGDKIYITGNRQQVVDDFGDEIIFYIPWGHQVLLINKCRGDTEKALFYVRKTLENNWSRAMLLNFLDSDLYLRQGKAVNNFSMTLPAPQSDLALAITRDPYNFDFLTIREAYDEKELKDALMDNITNFLLELGNGFAFVGREVRLKIGETENFADMLFYNIRLHCYVVVEVKVREFDSADMGQLGTYMVAVNHQLKGENDSPTLGLLICRLKDNVKAQYALEASSQPMGISQYDINRFLPENYRSSLPTIEEIESELSSRDGEK